MMIARRPWIAPPLFDDLERAQGDHWRVQRDVDPATIYARYAQARARRRWAIAVIALLSVLAWVVLVLAMIAILPVI
jgi:type IV secretory pathway component VirB8